MGIRERLGFIVRAAQEHAVETAAAPATRVQSFHVDDIHPVDQLIVAARRSGWGTGQISRDQAMQVPAVLRGRNLICSVATLPLVMMDSRRVRGRSPFLTQIDPQVTNLVTLAMTVEDLLCEAIAWWRITAFGWDGLPYNATRVAPDRVSLKPPPGARAVLPSGEIVDPKSVVWVDGEAVPIEQMIRFDSPNPGILKVARRSIRRAVLFEEAAMRYAKDPRPVEYFSPSDDADPPSDAEIEEILDDWEDARNLRATAYVPAGLKYNSVDVMSPVDMQLAELQKRVALDLANALGLDPEDFGISTTSRTYQNASDRRQDRINDVMNVYMTAITSRLSMDDITRRGWTVGFDLAGYLRADPITRANYAKTMKELGAITTEEIRQIEGRQPMALALAEEAAAGGAPPAAQEEETPTVAQETNVVPIRAAFAAGQTVHFTIPTDAAVEAFAVDSEKRTIRGLALPYGVTASNGWARWQFAKGSLTWSEVSRVKFLKDHNPGAALGVATELTDTDDGLMAAFRVGKGPDRDVVLEDAADGILDGLSVGVVFEEDGVRWDKKEGAYIVTKATLREVSLTAIPAFDDSRLTSVAASLNHSEEGNPTMQCSICGHVHAAGTPCTAPPATNAAQPAAGAPAPAAAPAAPAVPNLTLPADFAAQLGAALAEALPGPRQVVSPHAQGAAAGRGANLQVRQPGLYRFDGLRPGADQFEFSADLFAMHRGDAAASERIARFMREAFPADALFADVSTGDVNELNPTRNRPDLYVDQLEYATPIWNAISKGSIGDSTPFTLPKFSSASGLVGDHSEGVEPTGGTFVTTGQTITPAPVSGKVEVTRETMDQGGNPQVSVLIWRQINRAYREALEAKGVAVLEAETPTAIALSAGGTDVDLAVEFEGALSDLQFERGGFRMKDLFLNKALFKALSGARDTTGRPLYPMILPQNANGQVQPDFAWMMIGMLQARPSWALATSTSAEESSYLFSREDVHGWASPPRELRFEYEVKSIWLGVWGYVATAVTRSDGIREITYDPTM